MRASGRTGSALKPITRSGYDLRAKIARYEMPEAVVIRAGVTDAYKTPLHGIDTSMKPLHARYETDMSRHSEESMQRKSNTCFIAS